MNLKFHNLRFNGNRNDFLNAEKLLEEIENIQSEKIFMGKNYNDIYNVFKSYVAYEYQSYESTEEKIAFLSLHALVFF